MKFLEPIINIKLRLKCTTRSEFVLASSEEACRNSDYCYYLYCNVLRTTAILLH